MKLLFFSDSHGMADCLKKLFEHAEQLSADRLIFLGDALYHGPRNGVPDGYNPTETVTLFNANKDKILAVRGNCDADVDQMMLEFPVLCDRAEILTENARFFLTHGHVWNEKNLPPLSSGTIFVQGHTHIPELRVPDGGPKLFNPGSISLPKNGFPQSFGFFDGINLSVRRLDNGEIFLTARLTDGSWNETDKDPE